MAEAIRPGGLRVIHQEAGTLTATAGVGLVLLLIDIPTRTAVIAHMLLPDSSTNSRLSETEPTWFVDTGVPLAVSRLLEARSMGESRDFDMVLVGGADIPGGELGLGQQNIDAASVQFSRYNLEPNMRLVGGLAARRVVFDAETCRVNVIDGDGTVHEA